MFDIHFYAESPAHVADIANAIAEAYCGLTPGAEIVEKAVTPDRPARPNTGLNLFMGVIAGGISGLIAGAITVLLLWRKRGRSEATPSSSPALRDESAQTEKTEPESFRAAAGETQSAKPKGWFGLFSPATTPFGKIINSCWVILFSVAGVLFAFGYGSKGSRALEVWTSCFTILSMFALVELLIRVRKERKSGQIPLGSTGSESAQTESPASPESQSRLTSAATADVAWPRALTMVAGLFLLVGVWSLLDMLFSSGEQNVTIFPGSLFLPLGIGLLNQREFCRRAAVWCVWGGFIFMLVMLGWLFGKAFGLFGGLDVEAQILGQPTNNAVGAILTFILFGVEAMLLPWMFLVLMRDEVRAACAQQRARPWPFVEWGMVVGVMLVMVGGVRLPIANPLKTGVYFTNFKRTTNAASQISGFGNIIERTLTNEAVLDFDSGKVTPELSESEKKRRIVTGDVRATWDWMAREGLDIVYFQSNGIFSVGMKVMILSATDWTNMAGNILEYELAKLPENVGAGGMSYGDIVPIFYGFQTSKGGQGILQITGFTENPRGVKIRYKLVEHGSK